MARFGFGPIVGKTGAWWDVPEGAGGIIKGAPGLTLDLCGIAKGHALDRIVAALNALSIRDSLIELGGEVAALGRHPEGRDWHVAIEDPLADGFVARHIVAPRGRALATSGHRARGLRGRWRSTHIIDPARDRPVDNGIASVTVLDETAMRADALATALCAMPAANTTVFAEKQGITALFVHDDGAETQTGDFAGHIIA